MGCGGCDCDADLGGGIRSYGTNGEGAAEAAPLLGFVGESGAAAVGV